MADVALKNGVDREIWLRCFSSALTGLLAGHQAVTYEPDQLIRQAGKLADIALAKIHVRHPVDADGARPLAASLLGERGQPAARDRTVADALDPAEAGQPQTHTRTSAFPFYASDFLAATGLMSNAAVGAYIRMLAHAWSNGPIPDQPKALARAMNHSVGDPSFDEIWVELKPKWLLTKRGWINCRLEVVRWERASYLERHAAPPKVETPAKEVARPPAAAATAPAPARR